jgi:hypothetical protein
MQLQRLFHYNVSEHAAALALVEAVGDHLLLERQRI